MFLFAAGCWTAATVIYLSMQQYHVAFLTGLLALKDVQLYFYEKSLFEKIN